MIENHSPRGFSLAYSDAALRDDAVVLVFCGNTVFLRASQTDRLPRLRELSSLLGAHTPLHAFTWNDVQYAVVLADHLDASDDRFVFERIHVFRTMRSVDEAFALDTAFHLARWYALHRFCGACGGRNQPAPSERALICADCGNTIYPTICPAVTTAITDGDRILLAKNAHGEFHHYALIAGYVEVGETIEEAARREIREEVGLEVTNLRYVGSQPWGISQSLMLGFHADLSGSDAITLQKEELSTAQWFRRDELSPDPDPSSLSLDLIERFRKGTL